MSAALDAILADVEAQLEVTVEIDSVRRGRLLDFDGSGDYVTFGDILDKGAADSFTVEVEFATTTTGANQTFASKVSGANPGWFFKINTSDQLFVYLIDNVANSVQESLGSLSTWMDGHFHRLSVVVDRSAQKVRGYVDGVLLGTSSSTAAVGSLSGSDTLRVGALGDASQSFNGMLYSFRFWDTARTAAEIIAGLEPGSVSSSASGLAILCEMDEGSGGGVFDETSNSRNGTIGEATWTDVSKTWYFSFQGRSTGVGETPANTAFPAYLRGVGPLSQGLAEDLLFSGLAANDPGSIILVQPLPEAETDQLSQFHDYTFMGYQARIKIGLLSAAYSAFETIRTTTVAMEPTVTLTDDGLQAEFRLAGALARLLEENLITKRYVGIPHCIKFLTNTGKATITNNAVYDVNNWTLIGRFRTAGVNVGGGSGFGELATRETASTNRQFRIAVYWDGHATLSGQIQVNFSVGGTSTGLDHVVTALAYDTNVWNALVLGVLDQSRVYLMINGVVVGAAAITGTIDKPAANIVIGANCKGVEVCDWRFLDRFIPEDEARGLTTVRAETGDLGLVGYWPFTDNTGSTVNDEGSGANDAALTVVLNTDFSWQPTDLGEPELAGRPMPIVCGEVINAPAQLIDNNRERYRGNVTAVDWHTSGSNTTIAVRSRGTLLTGGGTDYTTPSDGGGGVFSMTAQEDEPVTYTLLSNGTSEELFYVSNIMDRLLTERTRLADVVGAPEPLAVLCPWLAGYWTDTDTVTQAALTELLGGAGCFYCEDGSGDLIPQFLLPPSGYGPYGEPCLDLLGTTDAGGTFGAIAAHTGSITLAGWIRTNLLDQTAYGFGGSTPNVGTAYIITRTSILGNNSHSFYFQAVGTSAGKLIVNLAGTSLASPRGLMEAAGWYFVAATLDDTGNTMNICVGPQGGVVREVASVANSDVQIQSSGLEFGGASANPWVAFQHLQIWDSAKSLAQLQALMDTPPVGNESGLLAYAPLTEGSGSPTEEVTSTVGTLTGTQWAPKLVVNLNDTPSVKLTEFHRAVPAAEVVVRYAHNRLAMTDADIDTGVTQNTRLDLRREWKDVVLENAEVRSRYKYARKVVFDSALTDRESAQRLARALMTRLSDDRYIGKLTFPNDPENPLNISRMACGLAIGDEIGITATIPEQLATPRSFRVVGVAHNPLTLETTIAFWG